MSIRSQLATVMLWGDRVGVVSWSEEAQVGFFEFDPEFLSKGLDIAPLTMGLDAARSHQSVYSFPALARETYLGLPGLLSDSLPDRFGNSLIDAWLARQGRERESFSPVERLCYMGGRGMGALEFKPILSREFNRSVTLELDELVVLAQAVMSEREQLAGSVGQSEKVSEETLLDILRVGTSAGGARPKAVVAMNDKGEIRSGQASVPKGFEHWILKFDGVQDLELGVPKEYGRIEYAYHLMARSVGIDMEACQLIEENGRAHFMTKRFDRLGDEKVHMQTLCGLAHFDYNQAGAYAYEQVFLIMRKLRFDKLQQLQFLKRMLFNIMAKNLDDHTKNTAFIMTKDGRWALSPAYDITYSHNPKGQWTNRHQMTVNGKRSQITRQDILELAGAVGLKGAEEAVDQIKDCLKSWPDFAKQAGVSSVRIQQIAGELHYLDR